MRVLREIGLWEWRREEEERGVGAKAAVGAERFNSMAFGKHSDGQRERAWYFQNFQPWELD